MPKLVVLSEGYKDRSCELKAGEKATVGRHEDNAFQIPEPSISGHHCEIILSGSEVMVKDLDSTNGTYINDDRVVQGVLKAGQVMRLGQVEIRLENGTAAGASKKTGGPLPAVQAGVRLNDLEATAHTTKIDVNPAFKKKSDKINRMFIAIGIALGVIIIGFLVYALLRPSGG